MSCFESLEDFALPEVYPGAKIFEDLFFKVWGASRKHFALGAPARHNSMAQLEHLQSSSSTARWSLAWGGAP